MIFSLKGRTSNSIQHFKGQFLEHCKSGSSSNLDGKIHWMVDQITKHDHLETFLGERKYQPDGAYHLTQYYNTIFARMMQIMQNYIICLSFKHVAEHGLESGPPCRILKTITENYDNKLKEMNEAYEKALNSVTPVTEELITECKWELFVNNKPVPFGFGHFLKVSSPSNIKGFSDNNDYRWFIEHNGKYLTIKNDTGSVARRYGPGWSKHDNKIIQLTAEHDPERYIRCVCRNCDLGPLLEGKWVDSFTERWNDKGSGGDYDASFYRPIPTAGFYILGDYGKGGYGRPTEKVLSVKEHKINRQNFGRGTYFDVNNTRLNKLREEPVLKSPLKYTKIWTDDYEASWHGAFYRANCPVNFVSIGLTIHSGPSGYFQSDTVQKEVVCIRRDLVRKCDAHRFVWNDLDTGARTDFEAFRANGDASKIDPRTFIGHNKPKHLPYGTHIFWTAHDDGDRSQPKAWCIDGNNIVINP